MRALVTGASGFAGTHLVRHLAASGWKVEAFRGDIRRPDSVRRFRGDAVFHLAAKSNPGQSLVNPAETFEVNALGTLRLLRALGGFKGRVLVVSSGELYRMSRRRHAETDPLLPRNPYAMSKLVAEEIARAYDCLDVVIARPFNHTGPGQKPPYVCPSFARQVRTKSLIKVGQLGSIRDFTDVRDVVRAYRLLAEKGRRGATYNIASGKGRPIREILDTLIRLSGRPIRVVVDRTLVRPPDFMLGDASLLRRHTGWQPEIPFATTMADLLTSPGQ